MNGTPRKRFVTLMAAAAGVTAGLGAMTTPAQARVSAPATLSADTLVKGKASPAKATTAAKAPAKAATTAAKKGTATATAAKADATKKPVVNTAAPNLNENCGSEEDCRNANGNGAGY